MGRLKLLDPMMPGRKCARDQDYILDLSAAHRLGRNKAGWLQRLAWE